MLPAQPKNQITRSRGSTYGEAGADVRGQPAMVQGADPTPEGQRRERKGPYSPTRGRNQRPTQVPKNWNPKEGL